MNTSSLRRGSGIAALALTLSFGFAGCSSDDGATSEAAADTPTSSAPADMNSDMDSSDTAAEGSSAAAQTFGAGCADVPTSGAGSFDGMVTAPVASAASANPLLSTLVTAVKKAGLVDALNSADGITVFAPANSAFDKIPSKDLKAVLADKPTLTKVLTYHVVPGQLSPEDLAGTHETLQGEKITVKGSGEDFTVGTGGAAVVCGNIPTANATVYVVDSVLMPA